MKFGLHNSLGNANERCQLWLKCNETEKKPHGVDFILPGDGDKKKKKRENKRNLIECSKNRRGLWMVPCVSLNIQTYCEHLRRKLMKWPQSGDRLEFNCDL